MLAMLCRYPHSKLQSELTRLTEGHSDISDGLRSCPLVHDREGHLLLPPHLFLRKEWHEEERHGAAILTEQWIDSNALDMCLNRPILTNTRQKSLARADCSRRISVTQSTPMKTISLASSGTMGGGGQAVVILNTRGSTFFGQSGELASPCACSKI